MENELENKSGTGRDEQGRFIKGVSGNPEGMKPYTEEDKIRKKAQKIMIEDYVAKLTEALEELSPILIKKAKGGDMIAIIRISGMVQIPKGVTNTLDRLRLRRKYACVVLNETPELKGMIKKVRNNVAYGTIDDATLKELIEKRGQKIDKAKEIKEVNNLKFEEANLKPFFRLHPPRKGIKSKLNFLIFFIYTRDIVIKFN